LLLQEQIGMEKEEKVTVTTQITTRTDLTMPPIPRLVVQIQRHWPGQGRGTGCL
jgi:hypothetical protein